MIVTVLLVMALVKGEPKAVVQVVPSMEMCTALLPQLASHVSSNARLSCVDLEPQEEGMPDAPAPKKPFSKGPKDMT